MNDKTEGEVFDKPNLASVSLIILVIFLLLIGGVYYWVSKKSKGEQVFPAGVNYLSPKTSVTPKPVQLYDYAKLLESADWMTFKGKVFPYSFQYPKEMKPLTFIDDPTNAVTFKVNDLPAQWSIMLLVETISTRDKALVGKQEEFVRGYWKYFSGLSGLKSITPVTNDKGLKGFKAVYTTKSGTENEKYFFTVEGDGDHLLYIANIFGENSSTFFKRIINSLDYQK